MEIGIASPNQKEKMMQMKRYEAQAGPLAPQQPGVMQQAGDMVKNRAMNKGLDYGEKQITSALTPTALATPSATQMAGLEGLAGTSGAGLSPGAAQAVLGSSSSAAPLVAEAAGMTSAGLAGTTGAGLATTAGTGAATAGAGAGMAALGTAVPYVGAALLAGKALGFFNEGGQVGPLSPEYKMSGGPLGMGALSMYHDMMKKNMKSEGGPITPEYKMSGGPLGMGALSMYHDMMKKNMR